MCRFISLRKVTVSLRSGAKIKNKLYFVIFSAYTIFSLNKNTHSSNMIALKLYKDELHDTLQKNAVVKKFYLFGSALTARYDEKNSDIDVLIETADLLC